MIIILSSKPTYHSFSAGKTSATGFEKLFRFKYLHGCSHYGDTNWRFQRLSLPICPLPHVFIDLVWKPTNLFFGMTWHLFPALPTNSMKLTGWRIPLKSPSFFYHRMTTTGLASDCRLVLRWHFHLTVWFQNEDQFWIPHRKLHRMCILDFSKHLKMSSFGHFWCFWRFWFHNQLLSDYIKF